jgi:hypothetical protein
MTHINEDSSESEFFSAMASLNIRTRLGTSTQIRAEDSGYKVFLQAIDVLQAKSEKFD